MEYTCTWCWFGSCRSSDAAYETCGDLACACGCEPYEEDDSE